MLVFHSHLGMEIVHKPVPRGAVHPFHLQAKAEDHG